MAIIFEVETLICMGFSVTPACNLMIFPSRKSLFVMSKSHTLLKTDQCKNEYNMADDFLKHLFITVENAQLITKKRT